MCGMKARVLLLFAFGAGSLLRAQLPTGANVTAGNVTVSQAGNAMTVTQASRNAVVNWQSFNLGADASFRLRQTGADAAMLARVVGNDPSLLLGSLKADGKLFLINPKGILVGQGAVIDTAAFLATTLDARDDDFLRGGALALKGDSNASVVNLGRITAREGNVLLFAHTVKNGGEIAAANGTAGLGAGTEVYLATPDAANFVIKANLPASGEKTGVENSGVIAAAQAQLEAAGGSIYDLAVNQSGVVRATGTTVLNGRVLLTASGGTVGVSGGVSARNGDGSGGEILIGGDYRGANPAVANAARTVVTSTGKLDASAANSSAQAGRVIVWADDATRFLGSLSAQGQGGGFAEVSGRRWLDFNPASTVQLGTGGTLLLDPDALIISTAADSGTGTSGTDPFTFGATSEPATLNATTLQNQLAASNVILDTSTSAGDITFNDAVTWTSNNTLTARAGGSININADITGGATSGLALYAGRWTTSTIPGELGGRDLHPAASLAAGSTITVGTLTYGANAASNVADQTVDTPAQTGAANFDGDIHVGTLNVDLSGGAAGVNTNGSNNAIGAFGTTGTGTLSSVYVVDHQGGLDVTITSPTADGPYLQFITPGTLTLKSGSSLDFTSAGTVLLASTGGAFVNQAGSSVFGGNARFLIYSSTTGATTKGGLTGTEVFNHAYDINDDYSGDSTSRFFYTALSGSPILTYTADSFARTYGAADPSFTFTRTGLVVGVADDVTGAPALSATATQRSGVGTYAINIASGTLASTNYDFNFVPGTLTINQAPLSITANSYTRRVNLANPALDATYSGFVLGETAAALDGTLAVTTPANTASPVGTYAITPGGLTSANYAITFVPGTLSVTANAALLIAADNFARTYGSANPTFTATYSGLVGGDTSSVVSGLQFGTVATQSSGVGAYTITPFGATAAGYNISYATGTLTINRAPLTIAVPNQGRYYGDPNDLTANFNGLVNGDTSTVVSGLSLSTAATLLSDVGTYGITASGATAANYSITYAPGLLSVLPAPLTISVDPATRVYGEADPVFNYTVTGLKNGDSAGLVQVADLSSLATATAGIGAYGTIGFPSTTSANYSVPSRVSGTLTITPRPLTITANNVTRIYGDANPSFTATYTGLASFDTPASLGALNFSTQATAASGVGNWGITFSTVAHQNYTITPVFGTLRIDPAPLTLSGLLDVSRFYGRADPALMLPTVSGLKNNDTVAGLGLTFTGLPAATANVGSYAYSVEATNSNYTFTAPSALFRVEPAPITVAIGSSGRVFGDANPTSYELKVTDLAFNDTAAAVIGFSNPTEARTDVGTYAVTPVLNNRNYVITSFTGGAFVISPRLLTLTAADRTKIYGDVNPAFFGSVTGFAAGDGVLNVLTNYGFVTTATPTSSVGTYSIRPTAQTTTSNYITTFEEGTLTVTPAPLAITVADAIRAFGLTNPTFGVSLVQGLKNQDTLASVGLTLASTATTSSSVGAYPITGAITSPNYLATFTNGRLTISPDPHELDPARLNQLNNGSNPIFKDVSTTNKTIEVDQGKKLKISANPNVDYDTAPLSKTDFANYLGSFANQVDAVKAAMGPGYADFMKGKGEKGSAYESMSAGARQMLADWMSGTLSVDDLRTLIAAGDADASAAFGFIMPSLIDLTRAKAIADMTPMDREILGRLADLTERRRSDTIAAAKQKYAEMVATNAKRAEMDGLASILLGPGDFKAIVEGATQDAVGKYIGATIGAAAGGTAASAILAVPGVASALFPLSGYMTALANGGQMFVSTASSTLSGAAAGPGIAVAMAVVLAVRATQISESVKNENEYNNLLNSWTAGQQITSIADLKSKAMDQDMKLSTLMLSAELLKTTP